MKTRRKPGTLRDTTPGDTFRESVRLMRLDGQIVELGDVDRAIHKLALDWGLTQVTEEAVKAAVLSEHRSQHETLYGLINALTAVARSLSPDERYTLEANAGRLLESRLTEPSGGSREVSSVASIRPSRAVMARHRRRSTPGHGTPRGKPSKPNCSPCHRARTNRAGTILIPTRCPYRAGLVPGGRLRNGRRLHK